MHCNSEFTLIVKAWICFNDLEEYKICTLEVSTSRLQLLHMALVIATRFPTRAANNTSVADYTYCRYSLGHKAQFLEGAERWDPRKVKIIQAVPKHQMLRLLESHPAPCWMFINHIITLNKNQPMSSTVVKEYYEYYYILFFLSQNM